MPTYRITGPDGATYEVTPPEGTNPSESEILAQVQAQVGQSQQAPSGGIGDTINAGLKSARDWMQGAANNLVRAPYEIATGQRPLFTGIEAPPEYQRPPESGVGQFAAEVLNPVPGNMTQAGAQVGTIAAGPLGPLARILGAAGGAGAGSALSGNSPGQIATDTGLYGATAGAAEGASALLSKIFRSLPWMKDRINEGNAVALRDTMEAIDPAVGATVRTQEVSPHLRGGTTMAQMRQAATGGDIQKAASGSMQTAIDKVNDLAYQPEYPLEGSVKMAWNLVPDVVKQQIIGQPRPAPIAASLADPMRQTIGPVGPERLTLEQLQAVRSYIGSKAFKLAPAAQGLDEAALQLLRGDLTSTIEAQLPPAALEGWRAANRTYGGTTVIDEFLNDITAKQGLPNRMLLNRNALSEYLDTNRQDLIRRMGADAYNAVVRDVLGGAQPGTRDILASGAGTPLTAGMQSIGRGTNTGSIQALGVPLRTLFPNLGSEYTGRAPYSASNEVQTLLDYLGLRAMDQFRQAQQGTPVPLGPIPGR